MSTPKVIIHVDMDAFFASIEQLDAPELRGRPIAIGGGARGVVSTASYEARRHGVRSAMPLGMARHLCPGLVVVPPRMDRYAEISRTFLAALGRFSPLVEQASVDEAYLDASGMGRLFGTVRDMGRAIKSAIGEATGGLTCSVGAAPVKFLSKIASDWRKPDGLTVLTAEDVPAFLRTLPVGKVPGVGKSLLERLAAMGVRTCGDVAGHPRSFWERRLGKTGATLHMRAQGIDDRDVVPFRAPKSESSETTFDVDTTDREFMKAWILRHADRVGKELRRQRLAGRTVTLKIRYADFSTVTRQTSLPEPTCATMTIGEAATALLDALGPTRPVRLLGVGVSGFDADARQAFLPLASPAHETEMRRTRLDMALDALHGQVTQGRFADLRRSSASSPLARQ